MKALSPLVALLALCVAGAASADTRVRDIPYREASVVRIAACLGFQTMIEFAPDERIENVGVGDPSQWVVAPNARANLLFVRTAVADSHSNMTVATSKRRYAFELTAEPSDACTRGDGTYYLRFRYPDVVAATQAASARAATAPVEQRNTAYTFSGDARNVPIRVFDDGRATYFKWAEGTTTPAIFLAGADGSETLVNLVTRGGYLVVNQIAPRFILRNGRAQTTLFNDSYVAPALDARSPQPRAQRRSCFLMFCGGGA